MKKVRQCRTCIYWGKPAGYPALSGRIYPCTVPVPEVKLPECISSLFRGTNDQYRKYMERSEGTRCSYWTDTVPAAPRAATASSKP